LMAPKNEIPKIATRDGVVETASQKGPEHPTVVGGKYVPSRSSASSVVGRTSTSRVERLLGLFLFAVRFVFDRSLFVFRFLATGFPSLFNLRKTLSPAEIPPTPQHAADIVPEAANMRGSY